MILLNDPENLAPQKNPAITTKPEAMAENTAKAKSLPRMSFHGVTGIDFSFASSPVSLSLAIFAGRFAIPAIVSANVIIEIVIEALTWETADSETFRVNKKLSINTQMRGQAIVQNTTDLFLKNSLIVLSKLADI